MKKINLKTLSYSHLVLVVIFIIGLYIAKDFGISWDEGHHRDSGQRVLVYIVKFFG